MIKQCISFCFVLLSFSGMAQQFSGKLINARPVAMDIVIFPFGSEYPVIIGTVDTEGQVTINLTAADISKIPKKTQAEYLSPVNEQFFFNCDYPDSLYTGDKVKAIRCEMPALWHNKKWSAALYLASDEKLQPWLEDRYYKEPVKASFFQLLYVNNDLKLQSNCNATYELQKGLVHTVNSFDLTLKKGFNFVEYVIEDIHTTDPAETTSIPNRIHIINVADYSTIKWMVKYFF